MRSANSWPVFVALFLMNVIPAAAQLSSPQEDPLARIREAAPSTPPCSATGESLCEQVAAKIIANAQGVSPLADNLRRLTDKLGEGKSGNSARVVAWVVAAFRSVGLDVHTEKYMQHGARSGEEENVVAEILGREKPDEWVLLGAHLASGSRNPAGSGNTCDAAMVIEAARDIFATGIRPRRSIRFVLFTGAEQGVSGSSAYVRSHVAELDHARAAIILRSGCGRVTGYSLNGRHDLEPGLREAMKPAESLGASRYVYDATLVADNFDFVVEGVPTLMTIQPDSANPLDSTAAAGVSGNIEIADLKRDTAIAGVTAFAIAERAERLGMRLSHAEIESLLKSSGLYEKMKKAGLWRQWESGELGRKP